MKRGAQNSNWKGGSHLHSKGYPRISAGPLRGQYVHRIVAEAKMGRPLRSDEDVHHRDGDRTNCHPDNLEILGHREHGFVSARQHFYMTNIINPREKREWDDYFAEHGE